MAIVGKLFGHLRARSVAEGLALTTQKAMDEVNP